MIRLNSVSLHFGARPIFDDVSFTIQPGEKIGLVGRNGSGKSTLLKMLSGEHRNYSGQIEIPSRYRIGYLEQSVDLDETRTPREICYTAFSRIISLEEELEKVQQELEVADDHDRQLALSDQMSTILEQLQYTDSSNVSEEIEKVLKGIGFNEVQIDKPVSQLSGGWKMRVELARLLLSKPDLLLLDEPTNHLDIESIIWFETYLVEYPGTVLVVSHDEHVLNTATKRTIEISRGSVSDLPYPYAKALEMRAQELELLMAAQANQQRQIAHKERLINKFRAKAGKASFAKALQSEIDRMDIIDVDASTEKSMRLKFLEGPRVGREAVRVSKLSKSYGPKQVITGLDLVIERGERIAFVGQNGQGKTTLARMITGEVDPTGGEIHQGHNFTLGYYAQNQTDELDNKLTVLETVMRTAPGETQGRLRSLLGSLLFEGDDVTKKVSVLSGGERARVAFACIALKESNVLIFDEPTNHLDINSKEILKEALKQFDGTLIVVSHDMAFLEGLTDHTLEFRNGKITKHLYGIDEFLRKRRLETLRELEKETDKRKSTPVDEKPADNSRNQRNSKEQEKIRRKVKNLEQQIERLEGRKAELGLAMSEDGFYQGDNHEKTLEEYQELLTQLEEKTSEWESLVEELM